MKKDKSHNFNVPTSKAYGIPPAKLPERIQEIRTRSHRFKVPEQLNTPAEELEARKQHTVAMENSLDEALELLQGNLMVDFPETDESYFDDGASALLIGAGVALMEDEDLNPTTEAYLEKVAELTKSMYNGALKAIKAYKEKNNE